MRRCRALFETGALALALLVVACGDDDATSGPDDSGSAPETGTVSTAPAPGDMCEAEGEAPTVAAYALEDGELRWVVCSDDEVRHDVVGATDEAVYVQTADETSGVPTIAAYDATDGTTLDSADPPPEQTIEFGMTADGRSSVEVDGVRVEGGQDDPTTGVDAASGEVLWEAPGSPAYDDVWAVGDGAVYVVDRTDPDAVSLVAYELDSGAVRWELQPVDPYGTEIGWPWHVADGVLFTIWSNLAVLDTSDGTSLWRTDYPVVEFPRMTGVRANAETVFVAFSSVPSGGD